MPCIGSLRVRVFFWDYEEYPLNHILVCGCVAVNRKHYSCSSGGYQLQYPYTAWDEPGKNLPISQLWKHYDVLQLGSVYAKTKSLSAMMQIKTLALASTVTSLREPFSDTSIAHGTRQIIVLQSTHAQPRGDWPMAKVSDGRAT